MPVCELFQTVQRTGRGKKCFASLDPLKSSVAKFCWREQPLSSGKKQDCMDLWENLEESSHWCNFELKGRRGDDHCWWDRRMNEPGVMVDALPYRRSNTYYFFFTLFISLSKVMLKEASPILISFKCHHHPQANLNYCPILLSQAHLHAWRQKLTWENKHATQTQHREISHKSIFAWKRSRADRPCLELFWRKNTQTN